VISVDHGYPAELGDELAEYPHRKLRLGVDDVQLQRSHLHQEPGRIKKSQPPLREKHEGHARQPEHARHGARRVRVRRRKNVHVVAELRQFLLQHHYGRHDAAYLRIVRVGEKADVHAGTSPLCETIMPPAG